MSEEKKIIIVGAGWEGKHSIILSRLADKNVEIKTVAEARAMGIDIPLEVENELNSTTETPEIYQYKTTRKQIYDLPSISLPEPFIEETKLNKREKKNMQNNFSKLHNRKFRR